MTPRRVTALLTFVRAASAISVLTFGWLLAPSTASACDVGIDVKPDVALSGNQAFGNTCSTGTSLAGVAILAVLVVVALTALASSVLKRAAVQAASLEAKNDPGADSGGSADRALSSYLKSVGLGGGGTEPLGGG